jgi:cell division protease FtsH
MVMRFGMSDKLGPMTLGNVSHEVFLGRDWSANADYSQETALEIDKEVRRLIDDGYDRAHTILAERRTQLDLMADVLIERETVDKEELAALLENRWDEFLAKERESAGPGDGDGGIKVAEEEPKAEEKAEKVKRGEAPSPQPGLSV